MKKEKPENIKTQKFPKSDRKIMFLRRLEVLGEKLFKVPKEILVTYFKPKKGRYERLKLAAAHLSVHKDLRRYLRLLSLAS